LFVCLFVCLLPSDPIIRFCRYNITREGGGAAAADQSELMSLDDDTSSNDALLKAKLDVAIEETLKKQADSMESVVWRDRTLPVKNDKVSPALNGFLCCLFI
jgi:hypothetical protein